MGRVALICPGCQTKYKVTIQGEATEKISFTCKKCSQLLEVDPKLAREEAPTTELLRAVCEKCGSEFVKNQEDDSRLCYQCRIDLLVSRKKQESAEAARPAAAPEMDKTTSRYTFRNPDGLVLGPIKLRTAAVLVREKRISGKEEVSRDGGDYLPLAQYPELLEFFPELAREAAPVLETEQIPLTEPEAPAPAPVKKPEAIPQPTDSRIYYLRLSQGKLLGPVKKNTVIDLIECQFLSGQDECSRDMRTWRNLEADQEFKFLLSSEEADVVELTETVEE